LCCGREKSECTKFEKKKWFMRERKAREVRAKLSLLKKL